ncbi:DnaB-like helicase C-terminal domain-containing protein [Prochlorococcus marinus]|uniref:DnaB-like helicase C-terminal domain-containing protein n=1 Tax=Prochlorococcus marinus TaxID=1219 RepID=UPI001AD97274|nr:DnaB-like helicase C-terminal domain-containing protein [Prochlorococcus marinus]MBO8217900.1 AAA family ATPase [Prochlorococcus marinus XMU1405]MBW3039239.1 hypothetical protein [Prochlorococcus marinus str. MU1405]MBW3046695.1 hypothetical protein [Prochlorococcus marinus str. MU1406]
MDKKDLATWFESLSKEEKEIVKLRFGIDDEEPLTLKEISLKLGIEISKAKLIEVKYIQKLRDLTDKSESSQTQESIKNSEEICDFTSLKYLLKRNFTEIENIALGNSSAGITTSFYDLDAMTQGLRRGDLIAFAGRPSMGKTSLALQLARNIASQNLPVCFFGFDLSKEELAYRLLGMEVGIEIGRIRTGRFTSEEWELVHEKNTKLEALPIYLEDKKAISIDEIKNRCRKISLTNDEKNLGLIVIDSYQLMEHSNKDDHQAQLEKNIKELKNLAKELNVPVLITGPISRGVEERENCRPMLSDLRDSDVLEDYGDIIVMLYRDEYYDPDTEDRGIAELIVTTHRNGPVGTVKMLFEPQFGRFRNLAA